MTGHMRKFLLGFVKALIFVNYTNFGLDAQRVSSDAGTFIGFIREIDVFGERVGVEKYLGIPYAEAPVGDRRFKKPEPKSPLDAPHNATEYGAACMQMTFSWGGVRNPAAKIEKFSEDFLFLNIHKPLTNSDRNTSKQHGLLPVFVFIHGGGFVCGSAEMFNGDLLSAYANMVVITINYRLAVWGFLSTGNDVAPGNLGLWDQHIALQWINRNIRAFGGDPMRITISGQSAGGASVVYQSLFPGNKGLFQRAIALAGSITCPWAYNLRPLDTLLRFADILGCDINVGYETVVSCIKSKSTEELHNVLNDPKNEFLRFPMEFVTTIDGEFLKEHPMKMITAWSEISSESHKFFPTIDFMTGITANEGGMMVHPFVGVDNAEDYVSSKEEFESDIIPNIASLMFGDDVGDIIKDMIIQEYTFWDDPTDTARVRDAFIEISSAYVFDIHTKLIADLHANISTDRSTYVYTLDENPSISLPGKPSWLKKVIHADDQLFLFGYDKEGVVHWSAPYSDDYIPETWELEVSKLF